MPPDICVSQSAITNKLTFKVSRLLVKADNIVGSAYVVGISITD